MNKDISMNYLEFNLLYGRLDPLSNSSNSITNITYNTEESIYEATFIGARPMDLSMHLHEITLEEIAPSKYLLKIRRLNLSEVYEKHKEKYESFIQLAEDSSINYYRLLFHKLTFKHFKRNLSELEVEEIDDFTKSIADRSNELVQRELERIRGN